MEGRIALTVLVFSFYYSAHPPNLKAGGRHGSAAAAEPILADDKLKTMCPAFFFFFVDVCTSMLSLKESGVAYSFLPGNSKERVHGVASIQPKGGIFSSEAGIVI